jgi:cytochrome c-type biogenesis protein CcmH/NrfG
MEAQADLKQISIGKAVQAIRENQPVLAESICREWLAHHPGCLWHLRVLGHALMNQDRLDEAESSQRFALQLDPDNSEMEEDLASVLAMKRQFTEAVSHFQRAIRLEPARPLPYKKLGRALLALGKGEEADEMFRAYLERDPRKRLVAQAIEHMRQGRKADGEKMLREALREDPDNVDAMRYLASFMLGEKSSLEDAEALLRRATQLAPDYLEVWMLLGAVLLENVRFSAAVPVFEHATTLAPENPETWGRLAQAQARSSRPGDAAASYARSIQLQPKVPIIQLGYAHSLKTLGDFEGALESYREAIRLRPDFGEAYWSMANLKVFRFEDAEVRAMEAQLQRGDLPDPTRVHFCFALGKAWEDEGDYDRAWQYYHQGNQVQRMLVEHDPLEMQLRQDRIMEVFSREFLTERAGHGCQSGDPIFIVGLPRAGSTLVEQILASHSQVEGTAELPFLAKLATTIGRYRADRMQYPEAVRDFHPRDWRAYGEQYLEQAQEFRVSGKPCFTDKLPNNFPHVGLLHLILPNAVVINARRHPIDNCLGAYKQLFAMGQNFTYDTFELAEYYRQYHKMMKHWHEVLPGKVLDVHYEDTVTDLEGQVRRILDHCGLPFEEACLRYHENTRAVKTASSEQVRQPIYRDAIARWRRYEPHINEWKEMLADIIEELPESVRRS